MKTPAGSQCQCLFKPHTLFSVYSGSDSRTMAPVKGRIILPRPGTSSGPGLYEYCPPPLRQSISLAKRKSWFTPTAAKKQSWFGPRDLQLRGRNGKPNPYNMPHAIKSLYRYKEPPQTQAEADPDDPGLLDDSNVTDELIGLQEALSNLPEGTSVAIKQSSSASAYDEAELDHFTPPVAGFSPVEDYVRFVANNLVRDSKSGRRGCKAILRNISRDKTRQYKVGREMRQMAAKYPFPGFDSIYKVWET